MLRKKFPSLKDKYLSNKELETEIKKLGSKEIKVEPKKNKK